jgi:hypothetical protein
VIALHLWEILFDNFSMTMVGILYLRMQERVQNAIILDETPFNLTTQVIYESLSSSVHMSGITNFFNLARHRSLLTKAMPATLASLKPRAFRIVSHYAIQESVVKHQIFDIHTVILILTRSSSSTASVGQHHKTVDS